MQVQAKESILMHSMYEIPDESTSNDMIEAVVVDEETVEGEGRRGSGAKILRSKGALERFLSETKSKDSPQEGCDGEVEVEAEIPSIVASM